MTDETVRAALAYHEADPPGKIAIVPTKPIANRFPMFIPALPVGRVPPVFESLVRMGRATFLPELS